MENLNTDAQLAKDTSLFKPSSCGVGEKWRKGKMYKWRPHEAEIPKLQEGADQSVVVKSVKKILVKVRASEGTDGSKEDIGQRRA